MESINNIQGLTIAQVDREGNVLLLRLSGPTTEILLKVEAKTEVTEKRTRRIALAITEVYEETVTQVVTKERRL